MHLKLFCLVTIVSMHMCIRLIPQRWATHQGNYLPSQSCCLQVFKSGCDLGAFLHSMLRCPLLWCDSHLVQTNLQLRVQGHMIPVISRNAILQNFSCSFSPQKFFTPSSMMFSEPLVQSYILGVLFGDGLSTMSYSFHLDQLLFSVIAKPENKQHKKTYSLCVKELHSSKLSLCLCVNSLLLLSSRNTLFTKDVYSQLDQNPYCHCCKKWNRG